MFGPELKNITGESKSLSEVLRLVDNLFNPLKNPVSIVVLKDEEAYEMSMFQGNFVNLPLFL